MSAPVVVPPATGRDLRADPRKGDTFRFGQLWALVVETGPRTVLRFINPGIREMTTTVALPLPLTMVPTPWTRQDLAYAASRIGPTRRKRTGR